MTAAIAIIGQFVPPSSGVHWPISLGWGSLLIPTLAITAYQWFKEEDFKPFLAVFLCACVWGVGYYSHSDIESQIKMYVLLAFSCVFLEQWRMVIISACMVALGVVMYTQLGRYITEATLWEVASNLLFGLLLVVPGTYILRPRNAPETEVIDYQEQQKAA